MIVWSLAFVLTCGMVGLVYLPYRSAKVLGPARRSNTGHDKTLMEADVEHALRLWYCATCGGHFEHLDQDLCSHCGASIGDGGGL